MEKMRRGSSWISFLALVTLSGLRLPGPEGTVNGPGNGMMSPFLQSCLANLVLGRASHISVRRRPLQEQIAATLKAYLWFASHTPPFRQPLHD